MVKKIKLKDLKNRLQKKETTLVDVMADEIYQNIHIEGALNIPFSRLEHDAYILLDPKDIIITYSIDYDCPVSRIAAEKLRESGFRRVYYYRGGLKEWLEADLPVFRSAPG
jgi:rhodanese-related sulfurtransferase